MGDSQRERLEGIASESARCLALRLRCEGRARLILRAALADVAVTCCCLGSQTENTASKPKVFTKLTGAGTATEAAPLVPSAAGQPQMLLQSVFLRSPPPMAHMRRFSSHCHFAQHSVSHTGLMTAHPPVHLRRTLITHNVPCCNTEGNWRSRSRNADTLLRPLEIVLHIKDLCVAHVEDATVDVHCLVLPTTWWSGGIKRLLTS